MEELRVTLEDLLIEDCIELDVVVDNWEEAIRKGGELLERCGYINKEYINAMISSVKELGPYVVIAPGIAMPHARPESGVKRLGLSIIVLRKPVFFGHPENDPVKIVVTLCATDNSSHLSILSKLAQILQNKEFINKLLTEPDKHLIVDYAKRLIKEDFL